MRNLVMMVGLVVGLGGVSACGSKDKFDEVLGDLEGFKARMCACADKACTDKVQDDLRAYRNTMKQKLEKDSRPSDAQNKKGRALDEETRTCRRKFDPPPGSGSAAAPAAPATP